LPNSTLTDVGVAGKGWKSGLFTVRNSVYDSTEENEKKIGAAILVGLPPLRHKHAARLNSGYGWILQDD
jgi:hypothetical protein